MFIYCVLSFPCPDTDMSPKITGELLRLLRQAMKSCKYFSEPIQAYIVPSGDAHQVRDVSHAGICSTPIMTLTASVLSLHWIFHPWFLRPTFTINSFAPPTFSFRVTKRLKWHRWHLKCLDWLMSTSR